MNQIRSLKEKIDNIQAILCKKSYELQASPVARDGFYTVVRLTGKYLDYALYELPFTGTDWVKHAPVQQSLRFVDQVLRLSLAEIDAGHEEEIYSFVQFLSAEVCGIKPYLFCGRSAFQYCVEDVMANKVSDPDAIANQCFLSNLHEQYPTIFKYDRYPVSFDAEGSVVVVDEFWNQYSELVRAVSLLTVMYHIIDVCMPKLCTPRELQYIYEYKHRRFIDLVQRAVDTTYARIGKYYGV